VSKGAFKLRPDPSVLWVYSNEHFAETERAGGDTRFLDVLRDLKAQKLELELNERFQITGTAHLLGDGDPHALYNAWRDARAEVPFRGEYLTAIGSRLFGADNYDVLERLPEEFEHEVLALLSSAGLLDEAQEAAVAAAREVMTKVVAEHLAERPHLESQREAFGTQGGRAGNLAAHNNPLEELWTIMCKACPAIVGAVTADQFFGFDPPPFYEHGYDEWPMYLGIVGCYTALNMVGLRPDDGLSRIDRMPAIMSDASHAGHAAYCDALISADRRFCDKAKAIYRYRNIGTQVLRLEHRAK
jgi:hypothetical protein